MPRSDTAVSTTHKAAGNVRGVIYSLESILETGIYPGIITVIIRTPSTRKMPHIKISFFIFGDSIAPFSFGCFMFCRAITYVKAQQSSISHQAGVLHGIAVDFIRLFDQFCQFFLGHQTFKRPIAVVLQVFRVVVRAQNFIYLFLNPFDNLIGCITANG